MIRTVQGVVASINIKDQVRTSQYGNSKSFGIKLEGDDSWYNGMVSEDKKYEGVYKVKTGKDDGYKEITKGCTVNLCLKKSGDYENIALGQSSVINTGSAPQQQTATAPVQQAATQPAKAPVDWEKKDLQMNIGGLLHDASALVAAMIAADGAPKTMLKAAAKDPEAKGFDDTAVLGMVRHYTLELYKLKEGIITEIQTGVVDGFDDELPF